MLYLSGIFESLARFNFAVIERIRYTKPLQYGRCVQVGKNRILSEFRQFELPAASITTRAFFIDAVERRYRQFSAATLHADMLDKPALDGRGFARCSNRLLQRNVFLPINLAISNRKLHTIS